MEEYKKQFIEFLFESGAVKFGEFTLKSGRISPYFINTGMFNDGKKIERLGYYYASKIKELGVEEGDVIFGPAYKGIPLSVATAISLQKEFGVNTGYTFDRKEEKNYGDASAIVGTELGKGKKIIILDDVLTSGRSMRKSFAVMQAQGNPTVKFVIISVDRMEKGKETEQSAMQEISKEFSVPVVGIVTVKEIMQHLTEIGKLDAEMKKKMEEYLKEYGVME